MLFMEGPFFYHLYDKASKKQLLYQKAPFKYTGYEFGNR